MADLAGSIRKIAKTNELQEKVDKLIQEIPEIVKSNIVTERRTAYADSTGSTNVAAGAAAGANVTVGTTADGTVVTGPPAPPPTTTQQNTQTSAGDAALNSLLNNNTESQNNTTNNPATTDKTDSGHQTANNGGGTQFADQGLLGESNPDWLAVKNAMISSGSSTDDIQKARIAFLRKELGIDEVGDVFTGATGAQPTDLSNATNIFSNNTQGANAVPTQIQRGFVGANPDDHSTALLLRMDGWVPTPSDGDAFTGNQNSWSAGTPIKKGYEKFQLGYHWTISNPSPGDGATPELAIQAGIDAFIATNPAPYPSGNGSTVWDSLTVASVDGGGIPTSYSFTWYDHPGGSPNTPNCVRTACIGGEGEAICPSAVPLETYWPITQLGLLAWINGQFQKSPFDSEAPLQYTSPQSTATIYSHVTGQTYQVEPSINGGFMLSQTSATPYIMVYASNGQLVNIVPPDLKIFYTPR